MVEKVQTTEMDMNRHLMANKFKSRHIRPIVDESLVHKAPLVKQICSPPKKDLRIIQCSLENPLANYDFTRKSFTIDSPHFGLFREPATPVTISKKSIEQHQGQNKMRTAHLLSFGAEEIPEESKLTLQNIHNDSSIKYDLKFDSFQQVNQTSFRKPLVASSPKHLTVDKESIEEETGKDELKNQQSTSGPKDSELVYSREDEEEDIDMVIAKASNRAFKKQGMGGILSAESSNQQSTQSYGSKKYQDQLNRRKIHISIPELIEKHQATPSSELGKDLKYDVALYYSRLLNRPSIVQESHLTNKSSLNTFRHIDTGCNMQSSDDGEPNSINIKKELLDFVRDDNPQEAKSRDQGLKKKPRKLTSKRNSKTPKKKTKNALNKSKEEYLFQPNRPSHRSPRTIGSKRGLVSPNELTFKLDLASLVRGHKQTSDSKLVFSDLQKSLRNSTRLGITKSSLVSKLPKSGKQSREQSMKISSIGKSSMLNCPETCRARTPLSKTELKKFMEIRKLTSTTNQITDNSSNLPCRSAIRPKAKRSSKTKLPPSEEKNPAFLGHSNLRLVSTVDLRASKNSQAEYNQEKSLGKSQKKISGDGKMGEKDRARIRDMEDKHLEVSKTLTSRNKTANFEVFADAVLPKERPSDVTPERSKVSRKKHEREDDIIFPVFFKKSQCGSMISAKESKEPTLKVRNMKIDIGNLSSKVLSMLPLDQ